MLMQGSNGLSDYPLQSLSHQVTEVMVIWNLHTHSFFLFLFIFTVYFLRLGFTSAQADLEINSSSGCQWPSYLRLLSARIVGVSHHTQLLVTNKYFKDSLCHDYFYYVDLNFLTWTKVIFMKDFFLSHQ